MLHHSLQVVEDDASLIVEAVAKKPLEQVVSTHYDSEFKKDLPGAGYTKWEIEVTKVYKGDVRLGDKLVLVHDYYLWTNSDGTKQLISLSALKPAVKNKEYILFLKYYERFEGYYLVCDYEGMFAIPTDELKAKVAAGTLQQSDLDIVYRHETLHYLIPIYSDMVRNYYD